MGTSLYDQFLNENDDDSPLFKPMPSSGAPRSLYDDYQAEQQAPPATRPNLLSRTATAALGLGKQMVQHPIDTSVGIAKGIGQNVLDAAQMVYNPMTASTNMLAQEGGDPRKTAVRMSGAASLALPIAGRAAGMGVKALAGMDFAASAGLGAAQTPDDPGVGAALGLLMNAAPYAPGAARRAFGSPPIGPQFGPTAPVTRTVGTRVPDAKLGNVMGKMIDLKTVDAIANPRQIDDAFTPIPTPKPATSEVFPEGYSAGPVAPPVAAGALDRVFPDASKVLANGPKVDDAFDTPRNLPGTTERFPDGYSAGPTPPAVAEGALGRVFPKVQEILDTGPKAADAFDEPRGLEGTRRTFPSGYQAEPMGTAGLTDVEKAIAKLFPDEAVQAFRNQDTPLTPVTSTMGPTAPPSLRPYPNGYSREPELSPVKSAAPKGVRPLDTPVEGVARGPTPVSEPAVQPESQPVVTPDLPPVVEPVTPTPLAPVASATPPVTPPVALDAPPVAPIAAAIPEAPPVAPVAPAVTPAAVVDAPDVVSQPAPRSTVSPTMQPAKEPYLNWRTITDPDAPLGKSTAARLESLYDANTQRLAQERGFQGFDAQAEEATKSQVIKDLFDDPLSVDRTKLQGLTGAQVVAVKNVAGENARLMEMVSKEMASGTLSPEDMALAQTRLGQLEASTNEALGTIVGESARMGRDLGYLRNLSKLSTDPDVWMIHAKKALGDSPMTDDIMTQVRSLARAAADACGGA